MCALERPALLSQCHVGTCTARCCIDNGQRGEASSGRRRSGKQTRAMRALTAWPPCMSSISLLLPYSIREGILVLFFEYFITRFTDHLIQC
jgi:hypothetical protein